MNLNSKPSLRGEVRIAQFDELGNIIPGTVEVGHNDIQSDMFAYLASTLGAKVLETKGSAISSDDDLIHGHLYKVTGATVTVGGSAHPVGSFFIKDADTAVVFTSGTVKEVKLEFLNNLFSMSSHKDDFITNSLVACDGICYSQGSGGTGHAGCLKTLLDQGGDGTKTFIEFYGEYHNETATNIQISNFLTLGRKLNHDGFQWLFEKVFAVYQYDKEVVAGRRLGIYWRINLSMN